MKRRKRKKKEKKLFLVFEWIRGYKSGQPKLLTNKPEISVVYNESLLLTDTVAKAAAPGRMVLLLAMTGIRARSLNHLALQS